MVQARRVVGSGRGRTAAYPASSAVASSRVNVELGQIRVRLQLPARLEHLRRLAQVVEADQGPRRDGRGDNRGERRGGARRGATTNAAPADGSDKPQA